MTQVLQEKDANAQTAPPAPNESKKRGTKRSSPASAGVEQQNTKAAKKDDPATKKDDKHVYTAAELSDIHLEGEEDEEVPIFDTCNDMRRKFNEVLKKTTQANLARILDAIAPKSGVEARHIKKFLDFKGVQGGARSPAFYAGYVYFEKIRVKENKKKGKKRETMEEIWGGPREEERFSSWHSKGSPLGGFPREGGHKAKLTQLQGDSWKFDQYGQIIEHRGPVSRVESAATSHG